MNEEFVLLINKFIEWLSDNSIKSLLSAVSIPSDIAEGQARQHTKEFRQYLYMALGSVAEVDTQIVIVKELDYISTQETANVEELILELQKMIHTLIKRLPET